MIAFWRSSSHIVDQIYLPKYYDPTLDADLSRLKKRYDLVSIGQLIDDGVVTVATGDEVGKLSYGTGDVPFVRTSDIANWEIVGAPKQGLYKEIWSRFAPRQDVRVGDILFVRDGTYLIGTSCIVTELDPPLVYQSHLLKFRVAPRRGAINRALFHLALNAEIVQRQLQSFRFTADTIDTIGARYRQVLFPVPRDKRTVASLTRKVNAALHQRLRGKRFVRQAPLLIGNALDTGNPAPVEEFVTPKKGISEPIVVRDTISSELPEFQHFWMRQDQIERSVYLPKYYDPAIRQRLERLDRTCRCVTVGELIDEGVLSVRTGEEVGKMAYGTGNLPFYRTSDFHSWELKHDPKHCVSAAAHAQLLEKQDLKVDDVLLVRDGTYLVGNVCIVSEEDVPGLYCGGVFRIRALDPEVLSATLLLGLMSSYLVKRQIRSRQFTRDVIDTLGDRLIEVVLPIPRQAEVRDRIGATVRRVVDTRVRARRALTDLAAGYGQP